MMRKGFTKTLLLVGLTLGLATAAGCSQQKAADPVIATYQGHKVKESTFYAELKTMPNTKTALANLLLYRALDQNYGKKVSKATVTSEYNSYKSQYGSQFAAFLSQNNMTPKLFRRTLRLNLLGAAALKATRPITKAKLNKQWAAYKPTLTVRRIQVTDKATAEKVISELDAGKDFAQLASQYSVDTATKDKGGTLTVTSTDKTLDSTFKDAAYALKANAYTKTPVKTTDGYEVIKLVKNPGKGKLADHQKELEDTIYNSWLKSTTVMRNVFSKALKKANVKVTDADLKSALDVYLSSTDDTN
ncbi:peptidylprolyl isomerase [Lacticaseibacillus kribbianus]|uniref:peptidylprolyl isomerase n=1 Tax=Lacticaseibacillus kribbianus TaxID=2926292 RepID=UPI001CD22041|nr:peptidylprolyl isomerase [Lacticaseibacillus kribbianus]